MCNRDTLEEALDYARRIIGWDIRLGRDTFRTEFSTVTVTYAVEEQSYDYAARKWNLVKVTPVTRDQAIAPF